MKRELTLKELAAYLPYGLRIKDLLRGWDMRLVVSPSELNEVSIDGLINQPKSNPRGERHLYPVLRPLSDLTREITHNGETFVPVEKLNELFGYEQVQLTVYVNQSIGWRIDASFASTAITFEDMYMPIQKLLEWKFDIFGLIPDGLAIDINTLEK